MRKVQLVPSHFVKLTFRQTINNLSGSLFRKDGHTFVEPIKVSTVKYYIRDRGHNETQHNDTLHVTLSIMTLSIMTLSIMTLSIMTLSIMTLSIMTLSIKGACI